MSSKPADRRVLVAGRPDYDYCDNKVQSARYSSPLTFVPVAIAEQFRRFANVYFLLIGGIMLVGQYTDLFETAISPWTTLGPLALVISISLVVEGLSDYKRHLNDHETNHAPCVVLRRSDEIDKDIGGSATTTAAARDDRILNGRDIVVDMNKVYFLDNLGQASSVSQPTTVPTSNETLLPTNTVRVAFEKVRRQDIRPGHFVVVKNREMVPADLILVASSNDQGGAFIETSSIDGETNLKLRTSPSRPRTAIRTFMDQHGTEQLNQADQESSEKRIETIDFAARRLTKFSHLGRPDGVSALLHPSIAAKQQELSTRLATNNTSDNMRPVLTRAHSSAEEEVAWGTRSKESLGRRVHGRIKKRASQMFRASDQLVASSAGENVPQSEGQHYIAALSTEPPNASVHTFSGTLTLPSFDADGACHEIPLGIDNVLLRGAVIRNTEWVIGLCFFTGKDTKLVQNSFATPSKFSQLDELINNTVVAIVGVMLFCIVYLSSMAVSTNQHSYETLFYVGYGRNITEPWPYLPILDPPKWNTATTSWMQYFFLYVTLLNNFIPLSLYMTVEMVQFFMIWLVHVDLDLYDDTTNTRGLARSGIVTDLGRIQYIFTDKTGTLTQNVMRFKRCSVNGIVYGAPMARTRPVGEFDIDETSSYHPLQHLLAGGRCLPSSGPEGSASENATLEGAQGGGKLTFNAEMFLRAMSLCHTVVVEKDIDNKRHISGDESTVSHRSLASYAKSVFHGSLRRTRSDPLHSPSGSISDNTGGDVPDSRPNRRRGESDYSSSTHNLDPLSAKSSDGAPFGFAYQAESPDEGALVSAASSLFQFQVVGRDSNGIRLRCAFPSHLQNEELVKSLKTRTLSLDQLACNSASTNRAAGDPLATLSAAPTVGGSISDSASAVGTDRDETWTILAVNKFDSDRKRMSVLVRSPPELGGLPILFCKGADSAMLIPEISRSFALGETLAHADKNPHNNSHDADTYQWEIEHRLGLQVHLGEFAREGLRTLVLGMRILDEDECTKWLHLFQEASVAMNDREKLLEVAAGGIERDLYIVGSTAIEDRLQKKVPETIATLANAGIKLWVLTGDKRETAVEIGYATRVLTSKMNLTEVPDNGKAFVRTQLCMEFIRLIKSGRLVDYQMASLMNPNGVMTIPKRVGTWIGALRFHVGRFQRTAKRSLLLCLSCVLSRIGVKNKADKFRNRVAELRLSDAKIVTAIDRRRMVRSVAEKTVRAWLDSEAEKYARDASNDGNDGSVFTLTSEKTPPVFDRADSAKRLLSGMQNASASMKPEFRRRSINHLAAAHPASSAFGGLSSLDEIVDEDTLSLKSFEPGEAGEEPYFDETKRTILERAFAVDRAVRNGRLIKHLTKAKLSTILENGDVEQAVPSNPGNIASSRNAARALVIEGAALKHLLGDPMYEEILFAVAKSCRAVIACRVSPRQKALLVDLVRKTNPAPITLAIGDGANDVGMIQEAHVGVGISGKEGKQAVNAADFAIAQFRFLETLLLVHGRWNFFRLSTVVLFSFYKNAVMAGIVIVFTERTLYSGTPLFDEWILAMLNFVAAFPIIMTGLFDRCLSKQYVQKHPEVYSATRENQLITVRVLIRWTLICVVHVLVLYFCTVPQQSFAGGATPAFLGLMRNEERGNLGAGEGGDLASVGTVTFSCMLILMAYKVLFETRSIVHGKWPPFTLRKGVGEGYINRIGYTWVGVTILSIFAYFLFISAYQLLGRRGASQFSGFTMTANQVLGRRSMSWMLILFVPVIGMIFDVCGKVFSNMFFPTQTQIHMELESQSKMMRRRGLRPPSPIARQ